jgi:acid phosphatase (class A)
MLSLNIRNLIFVALLASVGNAYANDETHYLSANEIDVLQQFPSVQSGKSSPSLSDLLVYFSTRQLNGTEQWDQAHADDVYLAKDVALRFESAIGVKLTPDNAKIIFHTLDKARVDMESMLVPVKIRPPAGRTRPYVQYPDLPACDHTDADNKHEMNKTGSYPSQHAMWGTMWALILAQLAPEHSQEILARGYQFGESRLICGFHYPSDLEAGRFLAGILFTRLQTNGTFKQDLIDSKKELEVIRGHATPEVKKAVERARVRAAQHPIPAPLLGM